MRPTQRHLEAIQSLVWLVGDDIDRRVKIDWFPEGTPEAVDGETGFLDRFDNFTPKLLNELVKLQLIDCEHEEGTGLGRQPDNYNSSILHLLPAAISMGSKGDNSHEDARYAAISLDTYEFVKMLGKYFSNDEQRDLCMQLGLDYESVVPSSATKQASAQAIVEYMRRQNRLIDLWRASAEQRPNIVWASLLRG